MRFLGCQIEDKIENQIRGQIKAKVWYQVEDQ